VSEHAPLQRALYVVSQFPCLSETFIVREINTLIAQGVDVRILSLKPPSRDPIQRESAALLDRVLHPHLLRTLGGSLAAIARESWQGAGIDGDDHGRQLAPPGGDGEGAGGGAARPGARVVAAGRSIRN
jgi:hypothetical protein